LEKKKRSLENKEYYSSLFWGSSLFLYVNHLLLLFPVQFWVVLSTIIKKVLNSLAFSQKKAQVTPERVGFLVCNFAWALR
jgi:hypothetical protein